MKGFFSEINIMESIWLQKIAQKSRKSIYLFKERELEKVIEFGPPLFFNFKGGHTSSTFSNSCSFLRYAFLGLKFTFQNNDFWEKSFYYSSFYTKKLSFGHWSTIFWENRPTLVQYRVPPPHTKVKFFSLHFWMNQTISNVFPKLLEKTHK